MATEKTIWAIANAAVMRPDSMGISHETIHPGVPFETDQVEFDRLSTLVEIRQASAEEVKEAQDDAKEEAEAATHTIRTRDYHEYKNEAAAPAAEEVSVETEKSAKTKASSKADK